MRLNQRVGEVRRELGLDMPAPRATALDVVAFAGWVLLGLFYNLGGMLSFAALAVALLKMPANEAERRLRPQRTTTRAAPPRRSEQGGRTQGVTHTHVASSSTSQARLPGHVPGVRSEPFGVQSSTHSLSALQVTAAV